ncbi:MAG: DNA-protecting protein DprA [Candidatus Saganbacteria bacterium]|nr:DNA-protecting protein DprA [Candidatus Saganbacteria bacterium]
MNSKLKYWLSLSHAPKVGPVKAKKLLEKYENIEAACNALNVDFNWAEQEIERAEKLSILILCPDDQDYPENLKNIYDPSLALYVKGGLLPQDKKALAIVGTRAATSYGREIANTLARELSSFGITIISGLALGIDAAAHSGAERTIAVFGAGVDQVYPSSNRQLAREILEKGAWVSEFPIGMTPEKWTFPQRNRIISGLSLGVIVVEGEEDSGALITAKLASEQGREVFAVPGNIQNKQTKGPHWLIKQGAKLVASVDDILEELQINIQITNTKVQTNSKLQFTNLLPEEQKIIKTLLIEAKHIDKIADEAGLPFPQVSSILAILEIKRIIRQLPGKVFEIVNTR